MPKYFQNKLLIAHRGNTNGPCPERENNPEYIIETIKKGYHVETDVHMYSDVLYLGHDSPRYIIDIEFLLENAEHLWIHCKNGSAFYYLLQYPSLNIFFHTDEKYVLTSHSYVWVYPGNKLSTYSICVIPEWNNYTDIYKLCYGICSDYVAKLHENYERM